ncbi:hypothetical protein D3C87_657490 [compost metagenome]|uniref:hypothetical protein n=1 Tax=Pedobacter ghigonis TaxID=2730403 RepID=UPI000FAA310A|nr:hypothetical protein [Pedobacter ghigonis]
MIRNEMRSLILSRGLKGAAIADFASQMGKQFGAVTGSLFVLSFRFYEMFGPAELQLLG